jgi:hypothetical protein
MTILEILSLTAHFTAQYYAREIFPHLQRRARIQDCPINTSFIEKGFEMMN